MPPLDGRRWRSASMYRTDISVLASVLTNDEFVRPVREPGGGHVVSRRARLLKFAILGLLHEGATHGYELRRRLNTALGPFRALSYGTLYPALKGLLDRGLIAETSDPAGPSGRRQRVVYELTAAGKEHCAAIVARADACAWEEDRSIVCNAYLAGTEN